MPLEVIPQAEPPKGAGSSKPEDRAGVVPAAQECRGSDGKCTTCGKAIPEIKELPGMFQNALWVEIRRQHKPDCQWAMTRGFRQEPNPNEGLPRP